jgi:hypothetical protein
MPDLPRPLSAAKAVESCEILFGGQPSRGVGPHSKCHLLQMRQAQ